MSATKRSFLSSTLMTMCCLGLLSSLHAGPAHEEAGSRALVRVLAKSQQSGIFHEGRLISQSTVIEIGEFSGVVLDSRGLLVAYVGAYWAKLGGAPSQFAVLSDGQQLPADLVGFDERLSLVVLQAPSLRNQAIVLGSLENQKNLDLVAWENDRWNHAPVDVVSGNGSEGMEFELKVKPHRMSPIPPMTSGSILLDNTGRFLGIVSSGARAGLSSALSSLTVVPAYVMRDSLREVLNTGENVRAGWLGITMDAESNEIVVDGVVVNSPAARAGLKRGDVIRALNSKEVVSKIELIRAIRMHRPHSRVNLRVESDGAAKDLVAELVTAPKRNVNPYFWALEVPKVWKAGEVAQPAEELKLYPVPVAATPNLGMALDALTPQLAQYFKVPQLHGLLVTSVLEGSVASEVGFQAGDVLVKANEADLESTRILNDVLATSRDGNLFISFIRNGKLQKVRVLVQ